jgi:hypothetical protein
MFGECGPPDVRCDAGRGSAVGQPVQLCGPRGEDSGGSPATADIARARRHPAASPRTPRADARPSTAAPPGTASYRLSKRARHRIKEVFAWANTVARQSHTKHRGLDRVRWQFTLATAAYNRICQPKLLGVAR